MRIESDSLGPVEIQEAMPWGAQTQRALLNFPITGYPLHPEFIRAFAFVKKAAAQINAQLGYLEPSLAEAIAHVCDEFIAGNLTEFIVVDPFQGGAGTSTNMNFNEVIANLANQSLGKPYGSYDPVHPLHHVNLHQSTNDTYPTAVKVAVLFLLKDLEKEVSWLQEEYQKQELEFKDVVKLGRTELQDAVPMTLGMEFGAYAEAIARDRWRIFKCRERIKVVNLGGTAIGTGLGAPREYIFKVTEQLRSLTGLSISRSENLVDATQNLDPFAEISGMLKTYAANLMKIANDLRLLSMGPDGGLAEIHLPELQAGSTIMPGKVNPVLPEAVTQVALRVIGNDQILTLAVGMGNLELNQLFPLIAHTMLETLEMLKNITRLFREKCVIGITPNTGRCADSVFRSKTLATYLLPILGYKKVEALLAESMQSGVTIREILLRDKVIGEQELNDILSPKRMYKLGYTESDYQKEGK